MNNETTLIILAGGKSSRMGQSKGLLNYKERFWILDQIENYIGSEVFIGLGFDAHLYFEAIPWLEKALTIPQLHLDKKVQVVINPTPEFGVFSTLQSVLKVLDCAPVHKDVLILPIDVPLINSTELGKILNEENRIVIPKHKNKNGHPVKLAPEFWKTLLELKVRDENSRLDFQIKKRVASEISYVEINDSAILKNLNSPADWQEFINS